MTRHAAVQHRSGAGDEPDGARPQDAAAIGMPPIPPETTVGWADTVWRYGVPPGARLRWLGEHLPVLRRPSGLESLLCPHVTRWGERADVSAVLRSSARRHRLDALSDANLARLTHTYASYGWAFHARPSFGVRHDTLSDGWAAYWARRPALLREAVGEGRRAHARRLPGAAAAARIVAIAREAPDGAGRPSAFLAAVAARGGAEGWARTYVLETRRDGPASASPVQTWLVGGGRASLSMRWPGAAGGAGRPSALLTARVLETLSAEGISTFDLGRHDDADAADWASMRAERWRIDAAPAATRSGMLLASRSGASWILRRR